ncbi:hypothetical protein ACFJIX_12360 [Roseateles sp. UC29_93]|uniref:hypothetical protein n=1 Tax=Roseateles sp. UC29_93 TaxID=3350177 RepID=UPI00367136E0
MKRVGIAAVAACLELLSTAAKAETQITGQVDLMRTHDAVAIPGWPAPMFWFTLKGVTAVENCGKFSNGQVLFVGRDLQMMAFVMSALGKGLTLNVNIDAPETANGFCVARHVTVSKPT